MTIARIPEDVLERIKQEISVQRMAEAKGVTLRQHGADLIGLCPFHEDHEPSLVVTPSKNLWHCLGACQAGGSPIDWVMKAEGVSFRHAVELLRADFFPLAASSPRIVKRSTVTRLASPLEMEASDGELLLQVVGYYNDVLKQSPEALAYLDQRGLRSSELIDHFMLGYANRTLGYRLPAMNRKPGQEIRTRLQKLGLLRESGHEHLSGSLVIPIFSIEGDVLGAYGRKIRDDLRLGTAYHLYLPGPHRGVFNVQALKASTEIILCEALIDALTFWCAGFRNVTSSYGVEGFTADHLAAFKEYGTEHVLIAYDRDEAGDRAAEALSKKLIAEGIGCSRIHFPKGMDANEYALKVQPPAMSLGVLVRSAEWLGGGRRPERTAAPRIEHRVVQEPAIAAKDEGENEAAKERSIKVETAETSEGASPPAPPIASAPALPAGLPPAPEPAPAASPRPSSSIPVELNGDDEAVFRFGDRRYRVRGLKKNMSFGVLRLNLLVTRENELFASPAMPLAGFFVDTLDLYSARHRRSFEHEASRELGVEEEVVKRDLGVILRRVEELQQEAITKALEPKANTVVLSDRETAEAMELLQDPRLLFRILSDFERCGVVGEETNKLAGYLAAVSRKLERPLAVIIQSSSAAGKSSLMEAILDFLPEEEREKYSALTGMSLFYFQESKSLKHKVLAIVEEEGAERATYALKLLQSEGELTIASTGKEASTGRLVTQEYRVEGPVMIFLTTTAMEIDEELKNRCLVLAVDENREQTRAIHRLQRQSETIEGLIAQKEKEAIVRLHRNAQRLLKPLLVANPYAEKLTFLDDRTRTRRDHVKYLTLIRSIALLHQHQRQLHTVTQGGNVLQYVEVTLDDIAVANRIAAEVLGRSLDELPPQTRRLLLLVDAMVSDACERHAVSRSDFRFTRRHVRERTGWGNTQLKIHLHRLEELEYLLVHRGGRGQSFVYELLYDGQGKDGAPFLPGLIEVDRLRSDPTSPGEYDSKKSGLSAKRSALESEQAGPGRPQVGGASGRGRGEEIALGGACAAAFGDLLPHIGENAAPGSDTEVLSYTTPPYVASSLSRPNGNGRSRLTLRRP